MTIGPRPQLTPSKSQRNRPRTYQRAMIGGVDRPPPQDQLSTGGTAGIATMEAFGHILNWKLREGSHPFPGKDGGTCINEAALVAAGFEYCPIGCPSEMPHCFSR